MFKSLSQMSFIKIAAFCILLVISVPRTVNAQAKEQCKAEQFDASHLKGTWIGQFDQYCCNYYATFAMTIQINRVEGNKVFGYFLWDDDDPTQSAKSTLQGELNNGVLILEEHSQLTGPKDLLVLNGIYTIHLSGKDCTFMNGKWRLRRRTKHCREKKVLVDGASFKLRKLVDPETLVKKPETDSSGIGYESDRKVIVKDEVNLKEEYITLTIWDSGYQDGDTITLKLNGKITLEHYLVTKKPYEIILPLKKGENIIELYAENLGYTPPNTAAISIKKGGVKYKELILKSDLHQSEALKVIRD